jgi:hypothetical protein
MHTHTRMPSFLYPSLSSCFLPSFPVPCRSFIAACRCKRKRKKNGKLPQRYPRPLAFVYLSSLMPFPSNHHKLCSRHLWWAAVVAMSAVQFQESNGLSLVCGSWDFAVSFGGRVTVCVDVVVVENFRVPGILVSGRVLQELGFQETHIMIFQVSTGKSASLKDQSNFSSATGSSVGSWYGAR